MENVISLLTIALLGKLLSDTSALYWCLTGTTLPLAIPCNWIVQSLPQSTCY